MADRVEAEMQRSGRTQEDVLRQLQQDGGRIPASPRSEGGSEAASSQFVQAGRIADVAGRDEDASWVRFCEVPTELKDLIANYAAEEGKPQQEPYLRLALDDALPPLVHRAEESPPHVEEYLRTELRMPEGVYDIALQQDFRRNYPRIPSDSLKPEWVLRHLRESGRGTTLEQVPEHCRTIEVLAEIVWRTPTEFLRLPAEQRTETLCNLALSGLILQRNNFPYCVRFDGGELGLSRYTRELLGACNEPAGGFRLSIAAMQAGSIGLTSLPEPHREQLCAHFVGTSQVRLDQLPDELAARVRARLAQPSPEPQAVAPAAIPDASGGGGSEGLRDGDPRLDPP